MASNTSITNDAFRDVYPLNLLETEFLGLRRSVTSIGTCGHLTDPIDRDVDGNLVRVTLSGLHFQRAFPMMAVAIGERHVRRQRARGLRSKTPGRPRSIQCIGLLIGDS
jgi:hypothetical protein